MCVISFFAFILSVRSPRAADADFYFFLICMFVVVALLDSRGSRHLF